MVGDNWIEIEVPDWWLCYLEYGDMSGYSDDEIDKIDRWFSDCKYIAAKESTGIGIFEGVTCDLCEIIIELK